MRTMGLAAVAGLFVVATLHGQTVRNHSSLRIPTPAIDSEEESVEARRKPVSDRDRVVPPGRASERNVGGLVSSDGRFAPMHEASLLRETSATAEDAFTNSEPVSVGAPPATFTETALPRLEPISAAPVGSGTQFYGPSVSGPSRTAAAHPAGFSTATVSAPAQTWSTPVDAGPSFSPTISQTSFSAPVSSGYGVDATPCCAGSAPVGTGVVGMQPVMQTNYSPITSYAPPMSYAAPMSYPQTVMPYGPTTTFAPPVSEAAAYAPTLAGSTIPTAPFPGGPACPPGAGPVPFLVDPVAVNIPVVPIEERLQPVLALRPGVPEESYVGRGILGQPEVYVNGQHVRNVVRYLTLW